MLGPLAAFAYFAATKTNQLTGTVAGVAQTASPLLTAPLFAWSLTNGHGWPFDVWLSFIVYALCTVGADV